MNGATVGSLMGSSGGFSACARKNSERAADKGLSVTVLVLLQRPSQTKCEG